MDPIQHAIHTQSSKNDDAYNKNLKYIKIRNSTLSIGRACFEHLHRKHFDGLKHKLKRNKAINTETEPKCDKHRLDLSSFALNLVKQQQQQQKRMTGSKHEQNTFSNESSIYSYEKYRMKLAWTECCFHGSTAKQHPIANSYSTHSFRLADLLFSAIFRIKCTQTI